MIIKVEAEILTVNEDRNTVETQIFEFDLSQLIGKKIYANQIVKNIKIVK